VRAQVQIVLAIALLLFAGYVGYATIFGDDAAVGVTLVELKGDVVRTWADGARQPATQGMAVGPQDRVSVGADGNAVLSFGPEATVRLESKSSVRVLDVDATGVRIELEGGRVQARIRSGSPVLGVDSLGRRVVATDADFTMGVDEEGALSVRAERGRLDLQGIGGASSLDAGQRLDALPGGDAVTRIDSAVDAGLLLEVAWPEVDRTRDSQVAVSGRTGPYAQVEVGRGDEVTRTRAGADGTFTASVALAEGDNAVMVHAEDALGNHQEDSRGLHRDSQAPPATSAEVLWGP